MCITESMWLSIPSSGKELTEGFNRPRPAVQGGEFYKSYCKSLTELSGILINNLYLLYRIYERVVEAPYMDIPEDASFWLGQRNAAHGLFKVSTGVQIFLSVYECWCLSWCAINDSEWQERVMHLSCCTSFSLCTQSWFIPYLLPLCWACLVLFIMLLDLIACISQGLLF